MRLFGLSLVLAALAAAPLTGSKAHQASSQAVDSLPADLLAVARQVQAAAPEMAKAWPGYWGESQGALIYLPGKGAILVANKAPSQEYRLIGPGRGPAQPHIWHRAGDLPNVRKPFVINYPLGAGQTAILVFGDERVIDLLHLIFHEQFHGHQLKAFKAPPSGEFVSPAAIADRPGFAALAELERQVLASAIAAGTALERNRLLHDYLAIRRSREAAIPAEAKAVERQLERYEGTALFIDRLAVATAAGDRDGVGALLRAKLIEPLSSSAPFMTTWFRTRSYSVGAALTHFIRMLDPAGWQHRIEQSRLGLDEHLESLVRFDPHSTESLASSARSRYGYEAVRARLAPPIAAAAKAEIKSFADFRSLAPVSVTIHLPPKGKTGEPEGQLGFQAGPKGMVQISKSEMVVPDPAVVNAGIPKGSVTGRGTPFLAGDGKHVFLVRSMPELNGKPASPGTYNWDNLRLEGAGLELTISAPVRVEVTPDSVSIAYR